MEIHIEELKRIMNESLNIKGRADRRAYITLFVFTFIVSSIASRISYTLSGIVMVLFFIPQLSMNIRRLHDTNTSGKWIVLPYVLGGLTLSSFFLIFFNMPILLLLIFSISFIISIVYIGIKLLFHPGDEKENKYGKPLMRINQLISTDTQKVE